MSSNESLSNYDFAAEQRRVHEIVRAGTEGLRQTAIDTARPIIPDALAARDFLIQYNEIAEYRKAHDGQFPHGVFPPSRALVTAIDDLKAARTENIMNDPELSDTFYGDRQAAAESFFVAGAQVEVVEAVLEEQSTRN